MPAESSDLVPATLDMLAGLSALVQARGDSPAEAAHQCTPARTQESQVQT